MLKKKLLSFANKLEVSPVYKEKKALAYEILEDHNSSKKKYFDFAMIFLVISTIMIIILEIKNDLPPYVYLYESFAIFIFIIELLGRFWVASDGHKILLKTHKGDQGLSTYALVKPAFLKKFSFFLKPMSIIDLLAIIPTYRPLRILRFLLLFRLFKVFRYTNSLNFLMRVFIEKRFEFMTLLMIFSFMVFFASTAIYIFEGAGENANIANFYDAIYWAVITITTVGYGDISPVTPQGRFVTMLLIIGGIGIISFMTSIMTTAMTQKLQEAKSHQVVTHVAKLKSYILLCGYGKMGKVLAKELEVVGKDFVVIDWDYERIEEAKKEGFLALQADINDFETLKELQCKEKVNLAVAMSDSDVFNLSTILSLKSLNKDVIVFARTHNFKAKKKLEIAGAKEVIYPYATAANVGMQHLEREENPKKIIIYGYAKTASVIVQTLHLRKDDFIFVVNSPEKAKIAQEDGYKAILSDLSDDENLRKIGISKGVEMLFCMSKDYNQNLFVTLSARALDKELKIISLCATKEEGEKMILAGANHTINPYEIGARRLFRLIKKEEGE